MTDLALEALKDAIRQKTALIVCGSGVSKSADPDALDWKGLLKSGIEESVGWGFADENWKKRQLQNLEEGDVDEWIAVADLFTEKLGGQDNGHFSRWLANKAGKLQLHIRDLPDAISKLACPISTTNYDDILSRATGIAPVPWSDRGQFINALNEKLPAILHLHGHWTKPESVILGTKSYQRIANDERAKFLQEFLTFKYSLVFVGCSEDGLSDQNLGKLKVWLDGWDGYGRDHFHLVTNQAWKPNRANSPIKMLKYGNDYQELPSFLLSLVPATAVTTITSPSLHAPAAHQPQLQTIDYEVPREECFGRDKEIEDVVSALLNGQAPISIAGGPGMGKTTIAVNALYDSRIRVKYGDRRIFVALDAAREPHAILTLLAAGLGLPATGGDNQLLSLIGAASAESPILAILDNADTPHGVDGMATERLLRLLSQVDGLALIVTTRGTAPIFGQKTDIPDLKSLTHVAAGQAFLAIAGEPLRNDPDLDPLLSAVDGHPLSIVLLAAQARGQAHLADLRLAFEKQRAELLKRPGINREDRLTSARASLRVSLENKTMSSLARRLFGLLAFLPAGMSKTDSDLIIGKDAYLARHALQYLRLAFERDDGRLRVLAPLRDCAKLDCLPDRSDKIALLSIMLAIASDAGSVAESDWPTVASRVMAEADNLDAILDEAIRSGDFEWENVANSLYGLAELHSFTGRGSVGVLDVAATYFRKEKTASARIKSWMASVYWNRSTLDHAKKFANAALALARKAGFVRIQADALLLLGQISATVSEHDAAVEQIESALQLYKKTDNRRGQANSLFMLANIASERSNNEKAMSGFLQAKKLQDEGSTGLANCIMKIGELEYRRENLVAFGTAIEKALGINKKIGAFANEANCLVLSGKLSLRQREFEAANDASEAAIMLFEKTGNIFGKVGGMIQIGDTYLIKRDFGEAESAYVKAKETINSAGVGKVGHLNWRFGEIYEHRGQSDAAEENFDAAIESFRIDPKDLSLEGWEALYNAKRSKTPDEAGAHIVSARDAWRKIGRLDLIWEFIDYAQANNN
jgi:tetratricopeptide (TPR) repeat protein